MIVVQVRDVRESRATVQRREAPVSVIAATEADHSEATAVSAPPGMEIVARSNRKPAKATPTAIADSETKASAPAKERHIRGRPERVVACIHRPRPPGPRIAVGKPTPVVIWRPAPGFVANPSPAVIGLIGPIAIAIRNPAIWLVGNPHIAVVGNVPPIAVGVQILRSGITAVGVTPGVGAADHVIAVAIPAIPIVTVRGRGDLVLRATRRRRAPWPFHRR